jgi:hypothetical protein
MIYGEHFAWAHIPRTGGDAVRKLLGGMTDLVTHVDPPTVPYRHNTFKRRGIYREFMALNMRRLGSWALSVAVYNRRFGLPPFGRPGHPVRDAGPPLAPEVVRQLSGDAYLDFYTDGGKITITHWLRMEWLREDLIAFVRTFREVTPKEEVDIRKMPTKPPLAYDHDFALYFGDGLLAELYRRNPQWAALELRLYGGLQIEI